NSRVFTAWDAQNRLQAYAVEGKGADLASCIHEWGGGVSKLMPLFAFAVKESAHPLTVMAPVHSANLIRQLTTAGASQNSGVLGMIKILNTPALMTKIKKHIRGMGFEDVVFEPREGRFYLGYKTEIFHTDSESDLVRLIFGPQQASQLHPFDEQTADVLEK